MEGFVMLKPPKTIHRAMNSWFSRFKKKLKNSCQNGSQKSRKVEENRPMGRPGSIYSSFLWILGGVEKSMFFHVALGRPKIAKKGASEGPGDARVSPVDLQWYPCEACGLPGRGQLSKIIEEKWQKHHARALTRHGPLARRI